MSGMISMGGWCIHIYMYTILYNVCTHMQKIIGLGRIDCTLSLSHTSTDLLASFPDPPLQCSFDL